MAIQVNGTTVINNSRALQNITSVDAATVAALGAAGVGGAAAGDLGGAMSSSFYSSSNFPSGYSSNGGNAWFMGSDLFVSAFRSGDGNARSVLRSTNYGQSFTPVLNWQGSNDAAWGNLDSRYFAWDGGNNAIFVVSDYYGAVVYTTNGGTSWSITSGGIFGNGSYPRAAMSAGGGYFYLRTSSGFYRSTNNGASWSNIDSSFYPQTGYVAGNTMIIIDYNDHVYRSTNYKTGWSKTQVVGGGGLSQQSSVPIVGNGSGNWVTGGGYWSTDDGLTWNNPTNKPNAYLSLTYVNGYFIMHESEYYAYSTNGAQWTYVATGAGSGATPNNAGKRGWSDSETTARFIKPDTAVLYVDV